MSTIYGIALREGEPVEGVSVELVDASGSLAQATSTSGDGAFTFDVEAGTWTIRWTAPGGDPDEGQIEVPEGEDAEIEIEV